MLKKGVPIEQLQKYTDGDTTCNDETTNYTTDEENHKSESEIQPPQKIT